MDIVFFPNLSHVQRKMNAKHWWHFYKQAPSWIDKPWMKMFHHFSTSSESDHDKNDWCRHWPANLNWTMAVTSIELHLEGTSPVYFSGHRVKGALVVHIGVPIIIAGKPRSSAFSTPWRLSQPFLGVVEGTSWNSLFIIHIWRQQKMSACMGNWLIFIVTSMVNIIMQSLTAVVADELMSCWKFTRVSSDSTFSSIYVSRH